MRHLLDSKLRELVEQSKLTTNTYLPGGYGAVSVVSHNSDHPYLHYFYNVRCFPTCETYDGWIVMTTVCCTVHSPSLAASSSS